MQPRQRDINVVGVKDTEDPEDGHEDNQDHDGSKDKNSPRKATLKILIPGRVLV